MIKPDNKKVSTQFLNYLKSTSKMSQSKPQSFKQKQPIIQNGHRHQTYNGPIEGDFSKIGLTYVLENDQLKKKDAIYRKPGMIQVHNQKYEEIEEPTDVQLIKEITKLEFLQKKGFLKSEQAERLQYLRGKKIIVPQLEDLVEVPNKKTRTNAQQNKMMPKEMPFQVNAQNMDPNMYCQSPYMSPKSKFGEPIYGYPQFNHSMPYNQPINYPQKPQYFDQGHPMNYGPTMNYVPTINYGPTMHSHQFDQMQTGYY